MEPQHPIETHPEATNSPRCCASPNGCGDSNRSVHQFRRHRSRPPRRLSGRCARRRGISPLGYDRHWIGNGGHIPRSERHPCASSPSSRKSAWMANTCAWAGNTTQNTKRPNTSSRSDIIVSTLTSVSQKTPPFGRRVSDKSTHLGRDFHHEIGRDGGDCRAAGSNRQEINPNARFQGGVGLPVSSTGRPTASLVRNRPLRRPAVVVCVCARASAGATRGDERWRPRPTTQRYVRSRPRHDCGHGRVPDVPIH